MKQIFSTLLATIPTVGALAFSLTPTVLIAPATQHIEIDSSATVRIHANDMLYCRAYSVQVAYNPQDLRCRVARNLGFFGTTTFTFRQIDSTNGRVTIDEAVLGSGGKDGSGDLAELQFIGLRASAATLTITSWDFRDTTNRTIAVLSQNGVIEVGNPNTVSESPANTSGLSLLTNYPNPFNPSTTIHYFQSDAGRAVIRIFSTLGEEIFSSVDDFQQPGEHTFLWHGKNHNGATVPSGSYFLCVETATSMATRKILLIR